MPKGTFGNDSQTDECNYIPTPAQIKAAAAEIRAGWTDAERSRRATGGKAVPAAIKRYDYSHDGYQAKGNVA